MLQLQRKLICPVGFFPHEECDSDKSDLKIVILLLVHMFLFIWCTNKNVEIVKPALVTTSIKQHLVLCDLIQLSPLLECDPTVCLPKKSKVTRKWPNFSRGDKPLGHTPTRVIIGILYQIFLHQTPSNRIPAVLRKYSI
jgi:hypothetical protein